jgi:hypothetical protein
VTLSLFRRLGLVDRVVEGVEAAGFKCAIYDKELVYSYTQCQRGGRGRLESWPLPAMRELSTTSSWNCQKLAAKQLLLRRTLQSFHHGTNHAFLLSGLGRRYRSQCSSLQSLF